MAKASKSASKGTAKGKKKTKSKGKGKALKTREYVPRPRKQRANPPAWRRDDPLFNPRAVRIPQWLHRVLTALYALYEEDDTLGRISVQVELMKKVNEHASVDSACSSNLNVRLRSVRDALSALEEKDLIKWHDLQSDDEKIELSQVLIDAFVDLRTLINNTTMVIEDTNTDTDSDTDSNTDSDTDSDTYTVTYTVVPIITLPLSKEHHRVLCMWFRGLAKEELKLRNLTKHDFRLGQDKWKKAAEATGYRDPDTDLDEEYDMDVDVDHAAPTGATDFGDNAVAGPSRLPETPRRPLGINGAASYPTPESNPRREMRSGVADSRPPIAALSLPTPAGTDSDGDGDEFHDARDDMDIDNDIPSDWRARDAENAKTIAALKDKIERLQAKIALKDEKYERLEKENNQLADEVEYVRSCMNALATHLYNKKKELRLAQKWGWLFWRLWFSRKEKSLREEIAQAGNEIQVLKEQLAGAMEEIAQNTIEKRDVDEKFKAYSERLKRYEDLTAQLVANGPPGR